eukprot:jgi/Tetstr1/440629/TSEL_028939.t1
MIRGITIEECLIAAMSAGETLFAAQFPQGYCGERFECFIGDKGVLGESSFEEVADQQCKGERWTGAYNGVAATYLGSGNRNAVYMIVPPLPMGDPCPNEAPPSDTPPSPQTTNSSLPTLEYGYCGERFECFIGDKGLLGESSFEEVADQQCKGERWTGAYNGVAATYLGSGNRNAVYMIVPPLPMGPLPPTAAEATSPHPGIIGGVVAVVVVALIVGIAFAFCRRMRTRADDCATVGGKPRQGPPASGGAVPWATSEDVDIVVAAPSMPSKAAPPPEAGALSIWPEPAPAHGIASEGAVFFVKADGAGSAPEPDLALDALVPWQNVPLHPEHIGYEVFNLHVTLPADLSKPPLRLLHIQAVIHRWEFLQVYESVPSGDYMEVPYCEAGSNVWDHTCMLSWRWAMGKPHAAEAGATTMSALQFLELKRKLKSVASAGLKYVWIDWACVPQYAGDPMVEIHRSRLYYARARAMIVLPGFRQLSRSPVMKILLHQAQLLLESSGGDDADVDHVIARALQRIINADAVASREYFGRVWTLAERMARHARREKLRQWLSLDIWLGMVVDAMLGGKGDAAAAIYWQKMFPTAVLQELSKVERAIQLAVEAFHPSQDLYKAVAELCRSGYTVWMSAVLQEEATRDWLKTYLLEEAGEIYSAFNSNDVVWSIYCFFCYDHDVTATKALRNLCAVAGVDATGTAVHQAIMAAQEHLES